MTSLDHLFHDMDEFCRPFLLAWHHQLSTSDERKRQRTRRLTLGEIMIIMIYRDIPLARYWAPIDPHSHESTQIPGIHVIGDSQGTGQPKSGHIICSPIPAPDSLLFYDRPRDHIGWHYDYNFYNGRHFTVLLPLVNRHLHEDRLSSAQLIIRQDDRETRVPTPPNTLIAFEGAKVFHKVTRLEEDELRVILSMTFCTRPQASLLKGAIRRFKDIAYFGVRALWS
ncbi:MAG: hypothetical protein IPM89_12810 [Candidatus Competibacteraceae bacterium]|nr:MAG: hypothetical protein IPM89_12810 [Candidatus Competibacteraceae bacterium]